MSTAAPQRPSRRNARRTDACGARRCRESRTTTVTPSRLPCAEYVIRPTRAPATTFTVARATNAPDRALIVALPGLPAVNVVDDPEVGESRPFVADQMDDAATIALPKPSVPEAVNTGDAPDVSVAVAGVTASFAAAPGFTVTIFSAPARPGALAARVAVAAFVSR